MNNTGARCVSGDHAQQIEAKAVPTHPGALNAPGPQRYEMFSRFSLNTNPRQPSIATSTVSIES
jgi:hypothetical protein